MNGWMTYESELLFVYVHFWVSQENVSVMWQSDEMWQSESNEEDVRMRCVCSWFRWMRSVSQMDEMAIDKVTESNWVCFQIGKKFDKVEVGKVNLLFKGGIPIYKQMAPAQDTSGPLYKMFVLVAYKTLRSPLSWLLCVLVPRGVGEVFGGPTSLRTSKMMIHGALHRDMSDSSVQRDVHDSRMLHSQLLNGSQIRSFSPFILVVIAPGAQILVLVDEGIPRMTSACDNYLDNMEAWMGDHSTWAMRLMQGWPSTSEGGLSWTTTGYSKSSDGVNYSGYSLSDSWRYGNYTGNDWDDWDWRK